MKIINTFAIVEESLYSVQFDDIEYDEFSKCFELWNDPVYLRLFFEKNYSDLNNIFWKGINIEEAIIKTRKDAGLLEERLLYLAETGKIKRYQSLSTLFEPLSKNVFKKNFEKDKAKGILKPSWLRIYAIRIDVNLFLVCGSAIKLTPTMNDREHLVLELQKLEFTLDFLRDGGSDNLEFVELF